MAVPHQKAVIAILLSSPSTLHKKWKENKKAEFTQELARLKVSDEAKTDMQKVADNMSSANKKKITDAAAILQEEIWKGEEPHPTDTEAASLIAKARELDKV